MPITVLLLGPRPKLLDTVTAPLGEIVRQIQQYWPEMVTPTAIGLFDDADVCLCVLMRDDGNPELCHALYCNGTHETHLCHYVHDDDGNYVRTDIDDQGDDVRWDLVVTCPSDN